MNKDQIIEDFFRSLRVALTNAFSYAKNHPYFIKSVKNFKLKLEETLDILNPLKIGVTNSILVVDGKNLIGVGFYDELARLLHQRKIKSIEIRRGATLEELVQFFSVLSLSQKDVFKNGGISALLKKEDLTNFTIEELDYSAFLQGEGQECGDIWGYMLREATYSNDVAKLNKLADDFGVFIKRFNEKDVFGSEGISDDINEFLVCLKERNKEKFDQCIKDVFLWLLQNKKSLNQEKLAKLESVFNGLELEDLSLFWEGLSQEENFDGLSMQLFSKISEKKNQPQVAQGVYDKVNEMQDFKNDSKVVKKIRNLLSANQDDSLSVVYRSTLESLIKGISSSGKLFFDQRMLKKNYRYIALSIFLTDKDQDLLQEVAVILEEELVGAFEDNDLVFLKDLWSVLVKRKKEGIAACANLEEAISVFVENVVLNGVLSDQQEFLLEMVSVPTQVLNFYLDKIFTVEKVDKHILNLFFKLFPGNLDIFYEKMRQRHQDMEFISSLIDALGQLDASVALGILEYIYSSANELIKLEVLKAMHKLSKVDIVFLMRQLKISSLLLRKELISVLISNAQAKDSVLNLLLRTSDFWGSKNKLLMENMQIVFDLGFIQAADRIKELSQKRFFWNKGIRNKAKQILKEWNVS